MNPKPACTNCHSNENVYLTGGGSLHCRKCRIDFNPGAEEMAKFTGREAMYLVQYRYVGGSRRWKLCSVVFGQKRAEESMAHMLKYADAPCEGRLKLAEEF